MRKIVHIDMDAFYASVEQRDNPELRGKPVIVAWKGNRSVVCAASYEARKFGVRSAMPALRAERLCPDGIFIAPDFPRYRAVSRLTREIFKRHTDLVEPLSLDEAYLDVTENKTGLPTATRVASTIREQIRQELQLTASAGVAPNKFLAKLASDWRKPDGLFVIQPEEVESARQSAAQRIVLCFRVNSACRLFCVPKTTLMSNVLQDALPPIMPLRLCQIKGKADMQPSFNVHVHLTPRADVPRSRGSHWYELLALSYACKSWNAQILLINFGITFPTRGGSKS
jgi:hypothetical protein